MNKRFEARQLPCDNANIKFYHGSDGDVVRVSEPVAAFAVAGEVRHFNDGSGRGKDTEAEMAMMVHFWRRII